MHTVETPKPLPNFAGVSTAESRREQDRTGQFVKMLRAERRKEARRSAIGAALVTLVVSFVLIVAMAVAKARMAAPIKGDITQERRVP